MSVGLRGWRFDEEEIFTDDGELKPLDEIPEEPRERLFRLVSLVEEPYSRESDCSGSFPSSRSRATSAIW
ncbi:MAG: hypothetical protein R6U58_05330 [Bacteroidales bacterium]